MAQECNLESYFLPFCMSCHFKVEPKPFLNIHTPTYFVCEVVLLSDKKCDALIVCLNTYNLTHRWHCYRNKKPQQFRNKKEA